MGNVIQRAKDLFLRIKNSSSEARYKMALKGGSILFSLMRYVILIAIGYIVLYPLFYMVSSAIRTR
ncbi:MAG: hypothetical protein IKA86_07365, partial [Paraprevotella sp.]|nr:hypothetical protein [Paraprevotella sp.]